MRKWEPAEWLGLQEVPEPTSEASLRGVGTGLCFLAVTSILAGEARGCAPAGRGAPGLRRGLAAAVSPAVTLDQSLSSHSTCTCWEVSLPIVQKRAAPL